MRLLALLVFTALVLAGCVTQSFSTVTGGRGQVRQQGVPLADVTVKIVDIGGTLSATTDGQGRFDIPVEPQLLRHFVMANPMIHPVQVIVERDGRVLREWSFEKGQLGPNYFDFGLLDIAKQPNNSFKPTPLRGAA
jgi:hypothetical protein